MAFLDWVKSKSQQQSIVSKSQETKPETAKEMYTREAAQEKANLKPLDQMPADQRAKVEAIKATLEKATQHIDKSAQAPSPAAADGTGNREAVRQNMTGQDRTAPALSPTSAEAGRTGQSNAPTASHEPPANTQDKAAGRTQQTVPRPRPSWER